MSTDNEDGDNIAETLARELPKPQIIYGDDVEVAHIALPRGWELRAIDNEACQPHPRRTKSVASIGDAASFLAFVARYRGPSTMVWCEFDPATLKLGFTAVVDDNAQAEPGWRGHRAVFVPRTSQEWRTWTTANGARKSQVEFATFVEDNEADVHSFDGGPSSLDMMKMALDFEAKADLKVKSKVNLPSGGVALEYVNGADGETLEKMRVFERFSIAIPVFWSTPASNDEPVPAYRVDARLRYRIANPPQFWFELIRPDLVHQRASLALIESVRAGIGDVPFVMGSST